MNATLLLRVHSNHVTLADLTQALSLSGAPHQLHAYDADDFPLGALQLHGDRVTSVSHAGLSGAEAFVTLLHDPRVHHVDAYAGGTPDAHATLPLASLLLLAMSQQPNATTQDRAERTPTPAPQQDAPIPPAAPVPAAQAAPRTPTPPRPALRRAQLDGRTIALIIAALILAVLLSNSLLHFL